MFVTKRDGRKEQVNLEKITNSVATMCDGFNDIDFYSIAIKTINGLYDGVTTKELDLLSIQTAVGLIADDPIYSKVAARLLSNYIAKEVEDAEIYSFSQSIKDGYDTDLISQEVYDFVMSHKRKLNNAVKNERGDHFEYYGLRVVYDRYLLRHPEKRTIIENPQYWLLRVACGLSEDVKEVINFYNMISQHEYIPSTPTLFNAATTHPQMSSCYLLDSPMDDLRDIEKRKMDIALLSKFAGGIGTTFSKVRGSGALIKGTNGISNGIIPFIHSLDSNVAAVNQCFLPNTKIKIDTGWIEIQDIKIGDEIVNTDGIDEVTDISITDYEGEMIHIDTDDGQIHVTPMHSILCIANGQDYSIDVLKYKIQNKTIKPEWKEAQMLNDNDIILSLGEPDNAENDMQHM